MITRCDQSTILPWTARTKAGRFENTETSFVPGVLQVARWKLGLGPPEPVMDPLPDGAPFDMEMARPDFDAIRRPSPGDIVLTWLGHSTFLLQMGGRNYLTDPICGGCNPFPLKMRRFERRIPFGVRLSDLPEIHGILISHSHYDHLDRQTLERFGNDVPIVCPLGVAAIVRKWGFVATHELSWGECVEDHGVRFTAIPAQHGSARTPFDRNRTLWCGWLVEATGRRAVFLGDTGYASYLRQMGDLIGPVDLAMIPIGAYSPRWFMRLLHMNPMEAVQAHLDLRARCSVAMHWGTFELADDPLDEAPRLLKAAISAANLSDRTFRIPNPGQTFVL